MKKKNYFIGLFLIVTTLLFTMVSSVEANNQIENEFQTNNILTQFKLQNNLWYSGNANDLFEKFGFTVDNVVDKAIKILDSNKELVL